MPTALAGTADPWASYCRTGAGLHLCLSVKNSCSTVLRPQRAWESPKDVLSKMVEEREQSTPLTFQNETETQGEVELSFHRVTQGPGDSPV